MTQPRGLARFIGSAGIAVLAWSCAGCGRGDAPAGAPDPATTAAPPAARAGQRPVALPDLSQAAAPVQAQIRDRFAALTRQIDNPATPPSELADAFGAMGQLFIVTDYLDAGETCFANAAALAPRDRRWPYYLGHVYRLRNLPASAAAYFEQALERAPNDGPVLVWLGEMYLADNRVDEAAAALEKAAALTPDAPVVLDALGRVAMARRDFTLAVAHLTRALELAPEATRIEYPLGLAHRELGHTAEAEAHLRRRGTAGPPFPDPLLDVLGTLLQNAEALEVRAVEAIEREDWPAAIAALRRVLELAPDNASARLNLGSTLFLSGDAAAARVEYEAAVRLDPGLAKAHYALGILFEADGRDDEAVEAFARAVEAEPAAIEAHLSLADALRRSGRVEASLPHYAEALRLDPNAAQAQFGTAMALVRLGRYQEARDRLAEGMQMYPDQSGFPHALARVLAAAPDARARDGRRALLLMQPLLQAQAGVALNETMAMVQAEVGDFDEAAAWQRNAIEAARQAGRADLVPALSDALAQYERRQPSRMPWRDDDPVFHPRPQNG
jgi:tetratricopeptide (TPR) repeat protein